MLVHELVKLSGVSARTLRYYDEIGLLKPSKVEGNGYRRYTQKDIDCLQQILFYRELDFKLDQIKEIINAPHFEIQKALQDQYKKLIQKRDYINSLLEIIEKMGGQQQMTNEQKFEVFKNKLIEQNEQQYGEELHGKYDKSEILASYGKIKDMTEQQFEAVQQLEKQLFERLAEALAQGDVTSDVAMEAVELHKRWLSFYWKKYTKQAHAGLAQMYVQDARFIDYYDARVGEGATHFLNEAIGHYATL